MSFIEGTPKKPKRAPSDSATPPATPSRKRARETTGTPSQRKRVAVKTEEVVEKLPPPPENSVPVTKSTYPANNTVDNAPPLENDAHHQHVQLRYPEANDTISPVQKLIDVSSIPLSFSPGKAVQYTTGPPVQDQQQVYMGWDDVEVGGGGY